MKATKALARPAPPDDADGTDRAEKADSSLARMLGVLDLFTDQRLHASVDDIGQALQVSVPTAYRYVRVLTDAGLLQRTTDAQVTLGPRVIVLDHYIRQADPVLRHGVPFMKELVSQTGLDGVVSALYGGQLLDTQREYAAAPASLGYGRGRPRPLFRGAAPKIILAQFAPAALHRLFDARRDEVTAAGLPGDWPGFRRHFSRIRKTGYDLSRGELEANLAALAAPRWRADGSVHGALSLVAPMQRMAVLDEQRLAPLVTRAAQDIRARMP